MEDEVYKIGHRYSFRVKNPDLKTLSYYIGEVLYVDKKEIVILDKFKKRVNINRDDVSTSMETGGNEG